MSRRSHRNRIRPHVESLESREVPNAATTFTRTFTFDVGASGAAEISAFDPASDRLFVLNAADNRIEILDLSNPATPSDVGDLTPAQITDGGGFSAGNANSVAVSNGLVAVAFEASVKTNPGRVAFYTASTGAFVASYGVGSLPDMLAFTPDGTKVLVANEGEPNSYGQGDSVDPEGSVAILTLTGAGVGSGATVTTAGFTSFNGQITALRDIGVRIFGPGATVAQDLEPEYIAVSPDGTTAYVTLQENNAVAVLDIATSTVTDIRPLGLKNHSVVGNGLDPSDRDLGPAFTAGRINIVTAPVFGMYQPDAIATYSVGGTTYYVTANEGDARDYTGFSEEIRAGAGGYVLDPTAFPNAATLKLNQNLGRLTVTTATGNTDGDGDFDQIHAFGARSFSIWNAATGDLVHDSGDALEQITALLGPARFNSDGTSSSFDGRSDNKGPEPEAVVVGEIDGRQYVFIGLERFGGVLVGDVTDPANPQFTDFLDTPGDQGPEGLIFIPAANSPTGRAAVVVSNEISGTVTMYSVAPTPYTLQLLHASDLEPGLNAVDDAPRFAAVVQYLEEDRFAGGDARKQAFDGSVLLSSGDNFIAGPFYAASGDPSLNDVLNVNTTPGATGTIASAGRAGIEIMNRIGFDASALGNHEFDQGQVELRNVISAANATGTAPVRRYQGATFPYLSANLNFAGTELSGNVAAAGVSTTGLAAGRIAPSAIIDADGAGPGQEFIGVIGLTTPLLASISSPGNVGITPATANNPLTSAQLQELAAIVNAQATVLQGLGIDKIVLLSHLQQFSEEQALAPLLTGVDVIVAGGSDTRLADGTDVLRSGDVAEGNYPFLTSGTDGAPVLVVSTDGNFSYVGRLVIQFDAEGEIITSALNTAVNGAYSTDTAGVERLYGVGTDFLAASTKATAVKQVTDAVDAVITLKDGTLFGRTEVYLNGLRAEVRTQETNLGSLTADANLLAAREFDTGLASATAPLFSIKNGGGIRDSIGTVESGSGVRSTTAANPEAGKLPGQVSDLDIENSLRFNNVLSAVTISAEQVKILLEHAVAAVAPGVTPGQFAQVGGIRFSYDPAGTAQTITGNAGAGLATIIAGNRVINAVLTDEAGNVLETLVENGAVVGDPTRLIRVVTLSFLVDDGDNDGRSGDNYPFATFRTELGDTTFNRVNLQEGGSALGEQRALERFFEASFPAAGTVGYSQADSPASEDGRIQNLAVRTDTVLTGALTPFVNPTVASVTGRTPVTVVVDRNADNGAEVTAFQITGITGGQLFLADGTTLVPEGGFVTAAQGLAGLRFVPDEGFAGAAGFRAQASLSASVTGLGGGLAGVTINVALPPVPPPPPPVQPVRPPLVTIVDPVTGIPTDGFQPFPGFTGTVQTSIGDVTGDRIADIVVGAGVGGGPVVKVFDGATGAELRSFFAYEESFRGGVNVAVGDVNGDGIADIVAGAGVGGGPAVKVFDGRTGALLSSFFAYESTFRGGVIVAVGDVNGDGSLDLLTTIGGGGGPAVKTFDPLTTAEKLSFFAYDPSVVVGLRLNAADVNADGRADIVVIPPTDADLDPVAFDGISGDALLGVEVG